MANLFWVGGTSSWDGVTNRFALTSGGIAVVAATTAADDVFFDAASGTVTVTNASGKVARSINCTGFTGTLVQGAGNFTLGDATAGSGNVAFLLSATMTYTLGAGAVNFISTSTTQQTITTNGKTLPNISINGAGSSYLVSGSLTCSGSITEAVGTLNTGNQAITCLSWLSSGSGTRTTTWGSSTITVTQTNTTAFSISPTNHTITANTATIVLNNAGAVFQTQSGSVNINGASINATGSGSFIIQAVSGGTLTAANVTRTGTAASTDSFTVPSNGALTVTGNLTLTGNSLANRMYLTSSTLGTAVTVTVGGTVSITNVDFTDITAAGAAGTWTGTSLGDSMGNTNITFTTPVTRYAVVAGSLSSTAVWSATSGGAGGVSIPLPQDIMIFDGNSAAGTYTTNMPRQGASITCTGFTRTLNISSTFETYGSVTLSTGMTYSGTAAIILAGRGNYTFTSAGRTITGNFVVRCVTGTYTLQDALTDSRGQTTAITLTSGTLGDGGFTVSTTAATSGFTATGGVLNASGTWNIGCTSASVFWSASGATINASNSVITLNNASVSTRTFAGGGGTYGNLIYTVAASSGQLTVTGSSSLNDLQAGDGRTIVFTSGTNTTLRATHALQLLNGISGSLTSVKSSVAATPATLTFPNGYSGGSDWLSVQDITAATNTWYAGANSTNVSGNTNVTFTAPPTGSTAKNLSLLGVG